MDYIEQNEELYRAWIGDKNQEKYYQKLKAGGFNWGAFFFRELQLLTRKMYTESIILIMIECFSFFLLNMIRVPSIVYTIVNIIIGMTIGFLYYPLYKWNIKRKIEKYKNQGLNYEEQVNNAKKYGGNKVTVAVIAMFLICIVVYSMLLIAPQMVKNILDSNNKNTIQKDIYFDYDINDNVDKKTWNLNGIKLSYNQDNWEEMTSKGKKLLKHKNEGNYLAYIRADETTNGIKRFKLQDNRNKLEQLMEEEINNNENIEVISSNWEEVNDSLYRCKMECSASVGEESGYICYYYYITNDKAYLFMTSETEISSTFTYEAEEIMDTIQNNL